MKRLLLLLLDFYQLGISPLMQHHCRFYPSCSQYAKDAIVKYGACKGSWKSVCRICRCHPLHPGGEDLP